MDRAARPSVLAHPIGVRDRLPMTTTEATAIRVRGLRKSYQGTPAVDGVDLDVRRGEVYSLLGPNGAGKTTTVEILEGHRDRDAGEVSVLGVDPRHGGSAWKSRLGLVLQSVSDFEELGVAEIVHHFAAYYPRPFDPDETIERVGLTEKRRPAPRPSPAGSGAGSTWRSASSAAPNCSSSMSRPPERARRGGGTSQVLHSGSSCRVRPARRG